MPENGFSTVTLKTDVIEDIDKMQQGFEPNMNRQSFIAEMMSFYRKYHCPDCGDAVAKKVRCGCKH